MNDVVELVTTASAWLHASEERVQLDRLGLPLVVAQVGVAWTDRGANRLQRRAGVEWGQVLGWNAHEGFRQPLGDHIESHTAEPRMSHVLVPAVSSSAVSSGPWPGRHRSTHGDL